MEDIALLKKIAFFSDLSAMEMMMVNTLVERAKFGVGENIVTEGTVCDAFYIIKEGSVLVTRNGRELARITKEEPVGEISFIDKGLRSATVTALEDTILIKIPSDSFEKLATREKDLGRKVYKSIATTLCRRLRETNDAMQLIRD